MLHFEVQRKRGERADYADSVLPPSQYPSCVLVSNYDWDDYGWHTWFCLYCYDDDEVQHKIGELKILNVYEYDTVDFLPKSFDGALLETFCSLGINRSYYENLVQYTDESVRKEILTCLNDIVLLTIDELELLETYKSYLEQELRDEIVRIELAYRNKKSAMSSADFWNERIVEYSPQTNISITKQILYAAIVNSKDMPLWVSTL